MERRLKERLTGAVVLVVLAVIFIPMILDNSVRDDMEITATNIPAAPDIEFRDEVLPVEVPAPIEPPQLQVEPVPMSPPAPESTVTPDPAAVGPVAADKVTPDNAATPAVPETGPNVPVETGSTEPAPAAVPASPEQAVTAAADDSRRNLSAWVIQLGSFSSRQNAEALIKQLQTNGFPGYIEQVKSGAETVYKVRVGPELSRTEAETIQKNLKSRMNIDAIILRFP